MGPIHTDLLTGIITGTSVGALDRNRKLAHSSSTRRSYKRDGVSETSQTGPASGQIHDNSIWVT